MFADQRVFNVYLFAYFRAKISQKTHKRSKTNSLEQYFSLAVNY